jgi:D-aspartate ligase
MRNIIKNKRFDVPALVLGSGKSGLGVIRSLGKRNIPVTNIYYDNSDIGYTSKYVMSSFKSPHPETNKDGFIDFLSRLDSGKKAVLFPTDSFSFNAVLLNKKLLKDYFHLPVLSTPSLAKITNENLTYAASQKYGIEAPRTFLPADLEQAVWFAEETGYPLFLKAAPGSSITDLFKSETILIENYSHLKNLFQIAHKSRRCILLQEYIPGPSSESAMYTSYKVKGEHILEFTAKEFRNSEFSSPAPRVLISGYLPDLFEPSRKILNALKVEGFSTITFKKDIRSGAYKLIKIVPWYNLSVQLAEKCGINFPYHSYIHSLKGIPPEDCSYSKENLYLIDPVTDILQSIRHYSREKQTLNGFLKPYVNKKVFTIPSLLDPKPFLRDMLNEFKLSVSSAMNAIIKKKVQEF